MKQLSPAGKMRISRLFLALNHPQALHLKIKNLLCLYKILDSVYRNPTFAIFSVSRAGFSGRKVKNAV